MIKNLSAEIHFDGFYESVSELMFNDAIEQFFYNDVADEHNPQLGYNLDIDWVKSRTMFAREYVENYALQFSLDIEFEMLDSPKYYNYSTDRIFVKLSEIEAIRIFSEVNKANNWSKFVDYCSENLSSRDGFASYYNDDKNPDLWGNVIEWDSNKLSLLLQFYVDPDFYDNYSTWDIMEKSQGNGFIEDVICECSSNLERLSNIQKYLNKRAARGLK